MKANARKCYNELKKLGCPVKEWAYDNSRGHFWIDAEESGASEWLDYWNSNMYFGNAKLNEVLSKHGLYFEWYNAGHANVYNA